MQLTFAIIKPHAVRNPCALQRIRDLLAEHRFKVVRSRELHFTPQLAADFYAEHVGKFFYNRLHTFMCSGPLEALILAHPTAIGSWRELMGPTKVFKAIYTHPDSVRGLCGLTDTRNACHGSDSLESVKREIGILFPEFDVDNWYSTQAAEGDQTLTDSRN